MKLGTRWLLLAVVCACLVGGKIDAGDKQNPATTPMNRDGDRHRKFLAIAQKGDVEVLFLGDSITHAWEGQKAWKTYFEPVKAANFGISGDRTGHVLWRLTEGKELEGISPKVAVLMIGTNNTGDDSAEQIAEGITLIVKTIHQKSPKTKVLLLAVFPRDVQRGTPNRQKIAAINKIIAKLDDGGKTVKYMDIGNRFLSKDGSLSKDIMPDALHLSPRGYEIWAEAIVPTVHQLSGRNPAILATNRDVPRHKKFLEITKKGDVDVLFLGDSITNDWEGRGKEVWKQHFEPLKAANYGIGGDQTGHVLWRITEGKELDGISPKVAVLMIGTNNTSRDSAEQIAEGITLVVKTIQEKSPKTRVLLLGVFPRDPQPGTKNREKIAAINKIIATLDDGGKSVRYLDIGGKFLSEDGKLTKEIMYDALHLTNRGYEIWAEAIVPSVKELMK